ncbi:FkbM family methyltransferase [Burkholderiales bacterium]|nr:FkbM family methyltransferase [Burkholderiales bacterium]
MRKYFDIFEFLFRHPLTENQKLTTIFRYLRWQVVSRILNLQFVFPFVNQTKLLAQSGIHSATGNYYVGLMSFEEMSFLMHFIRREELFIDVGANIGVFSVLASGVCGASSIAFEPSTVSFSRMLENISLNNLQDRIVTYNSAVDDSEGRVQFVSDDGSVIDHVKEPSEQSVGSVDVDAVSLDYVLRGENPSIIKIDVEGFETRVLNGAEKVLEKESLEVIIIELKGHGARYGYDENEVLLRILQLGFKAIRYDPFSRNLRVLKDPYVNGRVATEIFCRYPERIQKKLNEANAFEVLGRLI